MAGFGVEDVKQELLEIQSLLESRSSGVLVLLMV